MIFSSKQLEIARYYFAAFSQTQAFLGDLNEIYNRTQVKRELVHPIIRHNFVISIDTEKEMNPDNVIKIEAVALTQLC